MMVSFTCGHCGGVGHQTSGSYNRRFRAGLPCYCSRACGNAARSARKKEGAWHRLRFQERANAVHRQCRTCGRDMWLPASKAETYKSCSTECQKARRKSEARHVTVKGKLVVLERPCETCGATFRPRPTLVRNGQGRYCSQRCNPSDHLVTPENLAAAQQARREAQAAGLIGWKTGPDHHSWKGGTDAAKARQRTPEKREQQAATLRKYRAENPHKIREWKQRRGKGKVLPRLPWGTIPRLGDAQRWKCAICRVGIREGYHVDHIMPIAKGGKHEPRNLQLLCQSCNVRKSAKDPIAYMQEIGRLL